MNELELKLCDIQGRLFVRSAELGYDSAAFIRAFMTSAVAKALDSDYHRMQWAGEEYLLEEVMASCHHSLPETKEIFSADMLYWIGYLYRYWHYYDKTESINIIRHAPISVMRRNYMLFHTMDPALAIEKLKEIHLQKR